MSFFKIARDAGAAEYGKARAEKYGRRAQFRASLGLMLAALLVVGIIAAAQGMLGG
jgi:hypothetical protein